ncbi:ncaph [Symbiodinium natans]|uniref:Condensin complex subunit 2 n=1 Tax=Symbiodinium natans TaxID=878477 RepID=A0A812KF67_9DINO|nr:ncaph [Symbiodinium natans]
MASIGGSSLGELYSKCVQLVNENKISTKNAFELPLIEHMDDIVDSFMGGRKAKMKSRQAGARDRKSAPPNPEEAELESRFHEASCTIEASARIYACRVDCVHTDTYRVLGGLNSADANDEDGQPGEDGKPTKKRRICGVNTLERNEANLVQSNIEADEQSDPMFRRMAAAFDAGGAKGLLLSHLPLAEDMSLIFNGDVNISKAKAAAEALFRKDGRSFPADSLGLGEPTSAACKIEQSRLCPELDSFRRQLWGESSFTMPKALEELLGVAVHAGPGTSEALAACSQPPPAMNAFEPEVDMPDLGPPDEDVCSAVESSTAPSSESRNPPVGRMGGESLVPVGEMHEIQASQVLAVPGTSKADVVAFDELFQKFCGAGGSNQFAYFEECWSKPGRKKAGKASNGALADAQEGALAPVEKEGKEPKERQPKRPLFDLANLDKAAKPIETEPVAKHQLNEKATQWQLRKDVPPYMIDRITMPSWQTWSKVDFACLGLRPHLMLKLVKKPPPSGEGPHGFSDLFSTVVVENTEAFPWLASSKPGRRADDGDEGFGIGDAAGEDVAEDFDGSGLPAHLDVDPQELFLGPNDKVLPGGDGDNLGDVGMEDVSGTFMEGGLDFELAEKPNSAESIDIAYSRNSKFVDVKLVKKHLWSCLEKDISGLKKGKAEADRMANDSFQDLISRTVSAMPKDECENLSAAVCFICALHLCNEKNLELKTDPSRPLGDFAIVAPSAE